MALSVQEALQLTPGTVLVFGSQDYTFEVLSVRPEGTGVFLSLQRNDGYITEAHASDLDVAYIVGAQSPAPTEVPPSGVAETGGAEPTQLPPVQADIPPTQGVKPTPGKKQA